MGLFAPDDIWWRLAREKALLAGGPCALLLQVAHPLVAEGVYEHSSFAGNPISRLRATMGAILTTTFGDLAQATSTSRHVYLRHLSVYGYLAQPVGPFPAHTRYSALDNSLAKWVLATLVWTAQKTAQLLIRALTDEERSRHVSESIRFGTLFGVRADDWFTDWREFSSYFDATLRDVIEVGTKARSIARAILEARYSGLLRLSPPLIRVLTQALLPAGVAAGYGMKPDPRRLLAATLVGSAARSALPLLHPGVRYWPQESTARKRITSIESQAERPPSYGHIAASVGS
jgi:uncharacterized protein (DUF2236 family)